jgi:hypothetical protein
MADEIKFKQLDPLLAFDSNKIIAVQNDLDDSTKGWKAKTELELNPTAPADNKLVTQKGISDNVVHKTNNVAEEITGSKTFKDNMTVEQDFVCHDDASISDVLTVGGTVGPTPNDGEIRIRKTDNSIVTEFKVDGTSSKIGSDLSMETKKIINLADPTANQDAATKKFVDDNFMHKTGSLLETVTGDKTFDDNIYGKQTVSAKTLEAGFTGQDGKIVLRDNSAVPLVTFDAATNTYIFAGERVQNVADPVNALDVVNLQTLDTHSGTQPTLVALFTVPSPAVNTYTLPSDPAPNPSAPSFLVYNSGIYTAAATAYNIIGTTLTWLEPDGIKLEPGEKIILFYNASITGAAVINITEKGRGINVKHLGSNVWASTSSIMNELIQVDDTTNPSDPIVYRRISNGVIPDTIIDDTNSVITYTINKSGYSIPHAGVTTAPYDLALNSNINMVRSGSTVTVTVSSSVTRHLKNGATVLVDGVTPSDYDGEWTVTSVSDGSYTFEIVGTPVQPTVYGTTTIYYEPMPYLNNRQMFYSGTGEVVLKSDITVPIGYFFFVTHNAGAVTVTIKPGDASTIIRGITATGISTEWDHLSSQIPSLKKWQTVKLFFAGGNTWYIQHATVSEVAP